MTKPATAPTPKTAQPTKPTAPPARRIRAEQVGFNKWRLVEETYACPPTSTKVLVSSCTRVSAEDRVRIFLETALGLNRFGDSGLE
jgi:hypothetical protein